MSAPCTEKLALKLYFGYGSNLWREQMMLRCPDSKYEGIGRLAGFRWIINSRGYANIVSSPEKSDVVYGFVYTLTPSDEAKLDINEGVPVAYTKEMMNVQLWPSTSGKRIDVSSNGDNRSMLVYIDRTRVKDDVPKEEYVHRMNLGIRDAIAQGVPTEYVAAAVRPFIPAEGKKGLEELARRQALKFEDEL